MLKDFLKDLKCSAALKKIFDNHKKYFGTDVVNVVKLREDRFNVLCHGDLWANNVMYRYSDDGKVEECMFVDFQMCFYGTPMLDLHYFIINSLNKKDKIEQVDVILHKYHKHLAKNLKDLGYSGKIPSLLELQGDFLDTGAYGLFSLVSVFPIVTAPSSDESNLDNITSTSDSEGAVAIKRRMYTHSVFTESLEEMIPYFERKGYLE